LAGGLHQGEDEEVVAAGRHALLEGDEGILARAEDGVDHVEIHQPERLDDALEHVAILAAPGGHVRGVVGRDRGRPPLPSSTRSWSPPARQTPGRRWGAYSGGPTTMRARAGTIVRSSSPWACSTLHVMIPSHTSSTSPWLIPPSSVCAYCPGGQPRGSSRLG